MSKTKTTESYHANKILFCTFTVSRMYIKKTLAKLTGVMVLTSQTFIVPSKDAVASKSGLSGLNLQSKMVSTCPYIDQIDTRSNRWKLLSLLHM